MKPIKLNQLFQNILVIRNSGRTEREYKLSLERTFPNGPREVCRLSATIVSIKNRITRYTSTGHVATNQNISTLATIVSAGHGRRRNKK